MSIPPFMVGLGHGMEKRIRTAKGSMLLGTTGMTPDGRIWRYQENASTELAAGLFTTVISTPTNEQTVTVAQAIGDRTVAITASSISKDEFRDGYLIVTAGTGAGEMHNIKSNTATGADGAGSGLVNVTFYDEDGLVVAWSTSDTDVDLFISPDSNQIICPVDGQQLARGLTQGIIPVDTFYWALVKGLGAVKIDNAGAAAGLELDEKNVNQSLNHAGQGFIDGTPDATAVLVGYRQVLGYLVTEEDVVDNEMELVSVDIL